MKVSVQFLKNANESKQEENDNKTDEQSDEDKENYETTDNQETENGEGETTGKACQFLTLILLNYEIIIISYCCYLAYKKTKKKPKILMRKSSRTQKMR